MNIPSHSSSDTAQQHRAESTLATLLVCEQLQPYLNDRALSLCNSTLRDAFFRGHNRDDRLLFILLRNTGLPLHAMAPSLKLFKSPQAKRTKYLEASIQLVRSLTYHGGDSELQILRQRSSRAAADELLTFVMRASSPDVVQQVSRSALYAQRSARTGRMRTIVSQSNHALKIRLMNGILEGTGFIQKLNYLQQKLPLAVFIGLLMLVYCAVALASIMGAAVVMGASSFNLGLDLSDAEAHEVCVLKNPRYLKLRAAIDANKKLSHHPPI